MYIKKITLEPTKGRKFEIEFTKGINYIKSIRNQLGKSTILKSIAYAFGAKEEIFENDENPIKSVTLTTFGGDKISRSAEFWLFNDIERDEKYIAKILAKSNMQIRKAKMIHEPKISEILNYFFYPSQKVTAKSITYFKNIVPTAKKDIECFLSGINSAEHIKNWTAKIEAQASNKKISDQLKISNYIDGAKAEKIENSEYAPLFARVENIEKNMKEKYKALRIIKGTLEANRKETEQRADFENIIENIPNKIVIDGETIEYDVRGIVHKHIGPKTIKMSIKSVQEHEKRKTEIIDKIKILKEEKESILGKIDDVSVSDDTKKSLLKYILGEIIPEERIDTKIYNEKYRETKEKRDLKLKDIEEANKENIRKMGVATADEGMGWVFNIVLVASKYQENIELPVFIDSFIDDIKEGNPKINQLIGLMKNGKQWIISATDIAIDDPDINVIPIKEKIFE